MKETPGCFHFCSNSIGNLNEQKNVGNRKKSYIMNLKQTSPKYIP